MTGQQSFAGTWTLLRFMLRRDRIQLPLWILGIAIPVAGTLAMFGSLYPTAESRQEAAAVMSSPSSLAMTGPKMYLADYTIGSMMGHQMLGFVAIVVAVMSVLLVVRHTRKEEETGRTELVRASVIGRHANTTAVLLHAAGVNMVLALLVAVSLASLGIESVSWQGSLLFGAALAAVGFSFSGVAILVVQLMEHARGASGLSLGILAVALSRYRLMGSYIAAALANSFFLLFVAGLGMGIAGSHSMNDVGYVAKLIVAGLSFAPALWVVIGAAVVLIGVFPRGAALAWSVLVFGWLMIYLGGALQLPEWVAGLSPYHHIPRFPAESFSWPPLLSLTGVAAALIVIGWLGYRRRDLIA